MIIIITAMLYIGAVGVSQGRPVAASRGYSYPLSSFGPGTCRTWGNMRQARLGRGVGLR